MRCQGKGLGSSTSMWDRLRLTALQYDLVMISQQDRVQPAAPTVIAAVIGASSADARPSNRVHAIVDPTPSRFDLCIAWDAGAQWSTGQARLG